MQIVYYALVLLLSAVSFYAGKRLSDSYNQIHIQELQYQIRVMAVEKGIGYISPQPVRKYMPIGQNFMDKLKENGRATQRINTQKHSPKDGASAF